MATFRGYLTKKKHLTEDQVEQVISILKNWWQDCRFPEKTREQLIELIGSSEAVEKTERLFANEFSMYHPVFNVYVLKEKCNMQILEKDIATLKQGLCPFCGGKLQVFYNRLQYCRIDDKAYSIQREAEYGQPRDFSSDL